MTFYSLPAIVLNDSTLRDDAQAISATFSSRNRIEIALALEAAGVDEVELALPSSRTVAIDDLARVVAALTRAKPILWGPATKRFVNTVVHIGLDAVYLSVPLSCRRADRRSISSVIEYACERGLSVAISGEDASRVDLDLVYNVIAAAEASGARRFRYADTMGVLHPLRTHRLFRQLCAETDLELEFRGHDHFGLATANTVAAIQGGATHVSVSLSRIDERLGTAQLSETAHAIRKSTMHHTRIELPRIDALATLVSAPTEHPNLPVRTAGMARALVADALAMICPAIPAAATRVGG